MKGQLNWTELARLVMRETIKYYTVINIIVMNFCLKSILIFRELVFDNMI